MCGVLQSSSTSSLQQLCIVRGGGQVWAGTGVHVWYASTKTFPSVHTDNGCCSQCIVSVLCVLCVFVCLSWRRPPTTTPASTSLRHVRNAAGRVGDEMKERGRRGREEGILWNRAARGPHGSCVCLCQRSLPAVRLSPEGHLVVHRRPGKLHLFLSVCAPTPPGQRAVI